MTGSASYLLSEVLTDVERATRREADAPDYPTTEQREAWADGYTRACEDIRAAMSEARSRKCAYCGGASGTADVCCAECRQDRHAHCPSWPTCTRPDYGRPCDATR